MNTLAKTESQNVNSAFYIGEVFHKRFGPKQHKFRYPLYMTFLNLDEVSGLDKKHWWFSTRHWAPLQLQSSDYFKHQPRATDISEPDTGKHLKNTAIQTARYLGAEVNASYRVCMLAHLRSFGIHFSPVNFFFFYKNEREKENRNAQYVISEVSNTPWNKTHCYLIDLENPRPSQKELHVSPFMNLNMQYHWTIKSPRERVFIRIDNHEETKKRPLFTAIFSAKHHSINHKSTFIIFLRWPIVCIAIIRSIYWQALKLFLKRVPHFSYQTPKADQCSQTEQTEITEKRPL